MGNSRDSKGIKISQRIQEKKNGKKDGDVLIAKVSQISGNCRYCFFFFQIMRQMQKVLYFC